MSASTLTQRVRRGAGLLRVLVPREVRIRYRTSALDVAWAVVNPTIIMIVYGYILTQAFGVKTGDTPYLASTWAGLIVWMFFANALAAGVTSLIVAAELITRVYFPRESLPLAAVGATLPDLVVGVLLLFGLAVVLGVGLTPLAFAAVLPLVVIAIWTAVAAIFTSVMAVFARDLVHATHLFLRVAFFATPVMYASDSLPDPVAWTARVSPIAVGIDGLRATVLRQAPVQWTDLLVHLVLGLMALLAAIVYTQRVETPLNDVL